MRLGPIRLPAALALATAALLQACSSPRLARPTPVTILSYNVKHGVGMDGVLDLERAAAVIRAQDPDVVVLQEIDVGCGRSDGVDQARRLAELCGEDMRAEFGPFMDFDGGQYGMAILSRLPITAVHNRRLPDGAEPRTALEVRVQCGAVGPTLIVTGVHLYRTEAERLHQAELLLDLYEDEELPVLLVGDFNSQRGDAVMTRLEEEFTNPAKQGPAGTFPAPLPVREIDFVLLRPAARFEITAHRVVDEPMASDHRPVRIDLEVDHPPLQ